MATAKGSDILSVLEQPLNNQGNGIPTFTVMTDLTIDIYSARMEQRMFGTKTKDGIGWIPKKEHKTATYAVGKEGTFTKCKCSKKKTR